VPDEAFDVEEFWKEYFEVLLEGRFLRGHLVVHHDFDEVGHVEAAREAHPGQVLVHHEPRLYNLLAEVAGADAVVLQECEVDARIEKQVERAGLLLLDIFIEVEVELPGAHRQGHAARFVRERDTQLNYFCVVDVFLYILVLVVDWVSDCRHSVLVNASWVFCVLLGKMYKTCKNLQLKHMEILQEVQIFCPFQHPYYRPKHFLSLTQYFVFSLEMLKSKNANQPSY
jgi:hypothetical protein